MKKTLKLLFTVFLCNEIFFFTSVNAIANIDHKLFTNLNKSDSSFSYSLSKKRIVKILSIDGGGVRGIIAARILENIEERLPVGQKLSEHFDIISGTSAGGILALMLNVPNDTGKAKYSASFISAEFQKFAEEVFSRTLWQKIKSGAGWWDAKYDERALQDKLKIYFDDTKLSHALSNVIISTYEIEQDKVFFFKSHRAHNELPHDCHMSDLAYATSAAPTYFRPARLIDGTGKRTLTLIDGGVAANNPTLAAAVHAFELYGTDIELFIVSIGTGTNYGAQSKKLPYHKIRTAGKIGWANEIVSLLMYASTSVTDYEVYYALNFKKPQSYFRFQTVLEAENMELDNASPKNIESLNKHATNLIIKYEQDLSYIAKFISKGYMIHPQEKHHAYR